MNELINGLSLMLVGMVTVFCFLTLLVFCISISSKVINRFWPEALPSTPQSSPENDDIIAAITSAVHQYRNKHK
ncbi:OadG family protein [Pleionea mediterranea]|jgi:oxaloacetate decarboxylase gamma subunit|uniref:Probable oxaloacetate decarboxylase gamma chain n=1 Tax=Pleionea mediterranea TaxID=523701 RepID=A0A316FLQ5_9GAMM|nr:OadG family protein [Pleionea mediterranea]PWK49851.1 oxaloacetate decarboxylase gamma subunit [Pleionea mediterranea]